MNIGTGGSRIIHRNSNEDSREALTEMPGHVAVTAENELATIKNSGYTSINAPDVNSETSSPKLGHNENSRHGKMPDPQVSSKSSNIRSEWMNIVSKDDISFVTKSQRQTLRKFEETNEALHQFNILSEATFNELQKSYKDHVTLLNSLKTDLVSISQRVRQLKKVLKDRYPESFDATSAAIQKLRERHFQEMEEGIPTSNFDQLSQSLYQLDYTDSKQLDTDHHNNQGQIADVDDLIEFTNDAEVSKCTAQTDSKHEDLVQEAALDTEKAHETDEYSINAAKRFNQDQELLVSTSETNSVDVTDESHTQPLDGKQIAE